MAYYFFSVVGHAGFPDPPEIDLRNCFDPDNTVTATATVVVSPMSGRFSRQCTSLATDNVVEEP